MATRYLEKLYPQKDIDGRQWGLRTVGNRYVYWVTDTSGNPVIKDPETGYLYYADWNPKTHQFDRKELLSIASRKAFLKQHYFPPDASEQARIVREKIDDEENIAKRLQEMSEKTRKDVRLRQLFCRKSQPTTSQLVQQAPKIAPPVELKASGTVPPPGTIKRPLLLVYVKFSDSTGSDVPDLHILNTLIGAPGTFKTIADYYHQQFKGAVQLSVIDNKVYRVTLPMPAYRYAGTSQTAPASVDFNRDVWYAALKEVFDNQGVGATLLANITEQIPDTYYEQVIGTAGDGTGLLGRVAAYAIDPAICTPIVILHGQEEAAGSPSGTAFEANVHGHARAENFTYGFDWNGNFKSFLDDYNAWYEGSTLEILDGTTNVIKPCLQYRVVSSAIFGGFMGTAYLNMGVMTHELAHALFYLPDLYDVYRPGEPDQFHPLAGGGYPTIPGTEDDISGLGEWSLMAYNWTHLIGESSGSCPPNLDGYSYWYFQKRFCVPVTSSGDKDISDPFTPHVIECPDNPDELFILQLRCFKGYDAAIPVTWKADFGTRSDMNYRLDSTPDAVQPGILIEHVNTTRRLDDGGQWGVTYKELPTDPDFKYMLTVAAEAHGGTQHMLVDTSNSANSGTWNYGDRKDLFGSLTQNAFGNSTDPSNAYWFKTGSAQFNITNITADTSTCTASYHIEFTGTPPEDPDWDSLPDDPLRPEGSEPSGEPEPEEPEMECPGRPRLWRFRVLRHAVPTGFVQHW